MRIRLGREPAVLPDPLGALVLQLVATRRGHAATGDQGTSAWLFPGGQPDGPSALSARVNNSKMTNGSTETSKPAPNSMAWPAKSSSLSCLTKLSARDPSNQFRAADSALRPAGRDGGVSRRAAG